MSFTTIGRCAAMMPRPLRCAAARGRRAAQHCEQLRALCVGCVDIWLGIETRNPIALNALQVSRGSAVPGRICPASCCSQHLQTPHCRQSAVQAHTKHTWPATVGGLHRFYQCDNGNWNLCTRKQDGIERLCWRGVCAALRMQHEALQAGPQSAHTLWGGGTRICSSVRVHDRVLVQRTCSCRLCASSTAAVVMQMCCCLGQTPRCGCVQLAGVHSRVMQNVMALVNTYVIGAGESLRKTWAPVATPAGTPHTKCSGRQLPTTSNL